MSPRIPQGGSFSLFPRERSPSGGMQHHAGAAPGSAPRPSIDSVSRDSPSRTGRRTPLERKMSVRDGKKLPAVMASIDPSGASNANYNNASPSEEDKELPVIIQRPAPVALANSTTPPPPRCGTAFSEAQTLVRENSTRSRSSIAKLPLAPEDGSTTADGVTTTTIAAAAAAPVRSIFPEYNPNVPLAQQAYYPTQASPTRIPPEAISRRLYSPTSPDAHSQHPHAASPPNGPQSPPLRSPQSAGTANTAAPRRWPPPRANELHPAQPPEISTTEQLRDYWKVANGWKASASEGRVYTFKISCERDAPVYTLASRAQQPFYRLKLDPTSTSANVSVSRFDPARPYKPPVPPKDSSSSRSGSSESVGGGATMSLGKETSAKGWQEVLATTLEEKARHHAPHDGLVALLFPSAAARLAMENQYTNAAACATAERECARLVWDDDSGNHFLVHPALAMPFCVTIERNPTWSRTEYTLEHIESPQHFARLTKDGTGTGWLEIDTGIASKIDAVYLADVAVTALLLVAHADGDFSRVEVFEPPPSIGSGRNSRQDKRPSSRISRLSARIGTGGSDKKNKKNVVGKKSPLESFELDLESQTSELKNHSPGKEKDGTPGCARVLISVLGVTFKCLIWCATVAFKALTGCIALIAKCVTSEKL